MHLTSSPIDWYAARAGGVVAYVLLSANVTIGLLMTGKKSMKHWPRFALEDVHRFGGILVGTFLVLHITAVAIDAYLPFSLTSLVVPLVASYRPIWTALGIVAAELLLALGSRTTTGTSRSATDPGGGHTSSTSSCGARRRCTGSGAGPIAALRGSS